MISTRIAVVMAFCPRHVEKVTRTLQSANLGPSRHTVRYCQPLVAPMQHSWVEGGSEKTCWMSSMDGVAKSDPHNKALKYVNPSELFQCSKSVFCAAQQRLPTAPIRLSTGRLTSKILLNSMLPCLGHQGMPCMRFVSRRWGEMPDVRDTLMSN